MAETQRVKCERFDGVRDGKPVHRRPVTVRYGRKFGRNEQCPCGSKLKVKQCHGRRTSGSTGGKGDEG